MSKDYFKFRPPVHKYAFYKMEVGDVILIPSLDAGWVQSKRGKKKWRCRARAAASSYGKSHNRIYRTKSDSDKNLTVERLT
jgi:hypothetical protein